MSEQSPVRERPEQNEVILGLEELLNFITKAVIDPSCGGDTGVPASLEPLVFNRARSVNCLVLASDLSKEFPDHTSYFQGSNQGLLPTDFLELVKNENLISFLQVF